MASAPWYRVYDFVEYLYDQLIIRSWDEELTERWSKFVNELFLEKGVGWRLQEGQLERLGGNGFQEAVDGARAALCGDEHRTAHAEISEALKDLSRRPDPDLTGAVQHAMAALECTAREVTRDPRPTLGDIVKRHERLFPCPLDEVVTKLWGYTSEFGRHLREGRTAERPEVELVVAVAAALCSYLASKTDA